ncbi:MAG TPA: hypothetical protein VKA15_20000 [Isosphaeraceae bacterium]|nr:hypothetical protein [Isosphaeraceae bacterium]
MPTLAKHEAIEKLIQAVRGMGPDDLVDFYHEVFPERPKAELDPQNGGAAVRQEILDYLGRGVEVEEILDFWNAVFPVSWNVTYDDETDEIQYLIEPEAIRQAD